MTNKEIVNAAKEHEKSSGFGELAKSELSRAAHIAELVFLDKQVTRSFLRWVENEKSIAKQRLKEI